MEGVVLIVVMALPLEAALVLLWFGPLRSDHARPPRQSGFWGVTPQFSVHESRVEEAEPHTMYSPPDTRSNETAAALQYGKRLRLFYVIQSRKYFGR